MNQKSTENKTQPKRIAISGNVMLLGTDIYPEGTTFDEIDAEVDRVRRWKLALTYPKRFNALEKARRKVSKHLLKMAAMSANSPDYEKIVNQHAKLIKRLGRLSKRFERDYSNPPETEQNMPTQEQTEKPLVNEDPTQQLSSADTLMAVQELLDAFGQYEIQWCRKADDLTEIAIVDRHDKLLDTPPEPQTAKMLLETFRQALSIDTSVDHCLDDDLRFESLIFKLCWLLVNKD